MIREEARVIEVRNGRALVETSRSSACKACAGRAGCATLGGGREARVWAADHVGVERGMRVEVAVGEGSFLLAGFLVYMVPVAALLLGAYGGHSWATRNGFDADLTAAGAGISFMALALLASRFIASRRIKGPVVTRVIDEGSDAQRMHLDG